MFTTDARLLAVVMTRTNTSTNPDPNRVIINVKIWCGALFR